MLRRVVTVLAILLVAGCGATSCGGVASGLPCASASECRNGALCVPDVEGATRCMAACDGSSFLCDDGAVCVDRGADGLVCWFGGRTAIRAACSEPLECEPGTVCAAGATQSTCEQACDPADDRICREGTETCVAIAGTSGGFCQSIVPADGSTDAAIDAPAAP